MSMYPNPGASEPPWPDTSRIPPPPATVPPPYPNYGPPPGYSYPYPYSPGYYPGPMAPGTSGYATASLICSIVGLFLVPIIGPALGIIFGVVALNQIRSSNGRYEGQGVAIGGIVVGAIGLLLGFAFCALLILALNDPSLSQGFAQGQAALSAWPPLVGPARL